MEWHTKAASQSNAKAQYSLAGEYEKGENVKKDINKAIALYKKASSQGHVTSQFTLGLIYGAGLGIDKNSKEAIKWYSKAAAQDHEKSQEKLNSYKKIKSLKKQSA